MLRFSTNLVARVTPWGVLALAFVASIAAGSVPARAQDIFGFFRPYTPPVAPLVPTYQPSTDSPPLTVRVRPRRKVVRAEKPPIKATPVPVTLKPKDPGEIANPVPALLADATLRSGDMVMFPGGLRVFAGRPGTDHSLSDFQPLSRSGKAVPAATRKLVAQLRPGSNSAWSAEAVKASGKLALNTREAETTGRKRKSR